MNGNNELYYRGILTKYLGEFEISGATQETLFSLVMQNALMLNARYTNLVPGLTVRTDHNYSFWTDKNSSDSSEEPTGKKYELGRDELSVEPKVYFYFTPLVKVYVGITLKNTITTVSEDLNEQGRNNAVQDRYCPKGYQRFGICHEYSYRYNYAILGFLLYLPLQVGNNGLQFLYRYT